MPHDGLRIARWIALLLPAALLAGAWGSQLFGGLFPCEMCHWQRWPHYAALPVALLSFAPLPRPVQMLFVLFAGVLIAVSGAIGVFHVGVEQHWWQGITACTAPVGHGEAMDLLTAALRRPIIRCDVAQWTLFGISLAGFNAILSLGGAVTIFALAPRRAHG
ncbi:disulfide bond formation protein B [Sphingomonas psychrotolerans]|uniref:Disulfide bond formation protein B n=1 Tax=Sphingomonas psychrotolerans TaxID=1327635 RepID=A0ABU3N949_9SPHN|nr:disulfide bond formation protein B [Sphingomonas psychrotolerans]MDT8760021.1 disulfide bond formation protein B [Sphingomonas psychrotolerans]